MVWLGDQRLEVRVDEILIQATEVGQRFHNICEIFEFSVCYGQILNLSCFEAFLYESNKVNDFLTRVIQVLEVLTDCPNPFNNIDKHLTFVILNDLIVLLKLRFCFLKNLLSRFAESIPLPLDDKDSIVSFASLLRFMAMKPLVLARFTV